MQEQRQIRPLTRARGRRPGSRPGRGVPAACLAIFAAASDSPGGGAATLRDTMDPMSECRSGRQALDKAHVAFTRTPASAFKERSS